MKRAIDHQRVAEILRVTALLLVTAAAYAPVWRAGWLWDDGVEVTKNALVRSPGGLARIWGAPPGPDYFPLTTTVEWLEWHLWGGRPLGYHLVNVALHGAAALLFVAVLGRLMHAANPGSGNARPGARQTSGSNGFGGGWADAGSRAAWLGGFLFAVHPVAVESVAWISELKNTLSLPPFLLSLAAWMDSEQEEGALAGMGRRYIASIAWFFVAILAKSSVVMLPVVLLLLARWRRGRLGSEDWVRIAPFFVISAGMGAVTLWFQSHRAIGPVPLPHIDAFERWIQAGLSLVFYLRICLWPVGLLAIYPAPVSGNSVAEALVAWLAIVGFLSACWASRRWWARHLLLGGGFFVVNLLPILGFVDMAYFRISRVSDHFAYIALLGVIGLAAAMLARSRALASIVAPTLVLGLTILTCRYASFFHDEAGLWTRTLARNPAAWLAEGNLGSLLLGEHRVAEGVGHLERALRLNPTDPTIHNNLGLALRVEGRTAEALSEYEAAIRLAPGLAEAHSNLGEALASLGRKTEAVAEFERASELVAELPSAYDNLGNAFRDAGEWDAARREYARALALEPGFAGAGRNLAELDVKSGRLEEAVALYQRLVRLGIGSAEDSAALGVLLRRLGRLPEAITAYRKALEMKPSYPEALNNLGTALIGAGQREEAIRSYTEAIRLRPEYFDAHYNLGNALSENGQPGAALAHYAAAARLEPRDPDVRDNLAATFRALGREVEAQQQEVLAARLRGGP